MFRSTVNRNLELFSELLYRIGIWHRHDEETVAERKLKIFYSNFQLVFAILIVTGAIESDDNDVKIFSVFAVLEMIIFQTKLLYLIRKKKEILEIFNLVCDYSIEGSETYTFVNNKSITFVKFTAFFLSAIYFCDASILFVVPFVGTERKPFFQFGYPLDWRRNEFAYWAAFVFSVVQGIFTSIIALFSVLVWYLLANCSWRYEALGYRIKKMGDKAVDGSVKERQISTIEMIEMDNLYNRDLVGAITSYNSLKE